MKKLLIATSLIAIAMMEACNNEPAATMIGRQTPEVKDGQFTPELLWAMGRVGSYDASADGKTVAYNVSYYSVEENKSHTVIYTINTDGTGEKQLTTATSSESAPKYYNEDKQITYLAPDKDGVSQIWVMNADGSGRKQLSKCEKDVDDYLFSPDGKKAIVIHQVPFHNIIHERPEDLPKSTGLVIDGSMFRHWDHYVESIPHPFVLNIESGEEFDMLEGENFECPMEPFGGIEQLAWSPDNKFIAFTCRCKMGLAYAISTDSDIFLYDVESGSLDTAKNLCKGGCEFGVVPDGGMPFAPDNICDPSKSLQDQYINTHEDVKDSNVGYDINPQFSPDGKYVAWQSMERDGYESDRNRLCVCELATGNKTYVTEEFDSNVDAFCWDNDSKTLYFVGVWQGETHVYRTNLEGEVKQLTEGQYDYTGVALCGDQLLCSRQSMKEATELYLVDKQTGKATQVTDENKYFRENVAWGDVIPHWSKATDGADLLSWIILPPNFDENKKYPTLLFCEGGPQSPVSQFWSFRWNMMIMAANGYVVVAPNRRGLPGFGSKWNEDISTNYGGQCMQDLLSAIDDAVATLPYIDKDRLGCVGASFGGFSVYWLAGNHNKRFKCFIAHDGIFNLEQQYLETEEAWFTNWDLGGAFWHKDNPAVARSFANSPHKFVDKWDTPILCIHGDKDYRIVSSQAIAAFNAAQYLGIEAELLLFPDENHWVLKPQNGVLWQRTYFNWLDRWLK